MTFAQMYQGSSRGSSNWQPPIFHVVMVDNHAGDRGIMREYLERDSTCEFRIHEAATGGQGIDACNVTPAPDCVLLALRLPDMTALEVIERLRGSEELPPLAIIVLEGFGATTQGISALMLGAQDFLDKPLITPESLSRAVVNAIERFSPGQASQTQRKVFPHLVRSRRHSQCANRRADRPISARQ